MSKCRHIGRDENHSLIQLYQPPTFLISLINQITALFPIHLRIYSERRRCSWYYIHSLELKSILIYFHRKIHVQIGSEIINGKSVIIYHTHSKKEKIFKKKKNEKEKL